MNRRMVTALVATGVLGAAFWIAEQRPEFNETRIQSKIESLLETESCAPEAKRFTAEAYVKCTNSGIEKASEWMGKKNYGLALSKLRETNKYSMKINGYRGVEILYLMQDACEKGFAKNMDEAREYLGKGMYATADSALRRAWIFVMDGHLKNVPDEYYAMRNRAWEGMRLHVTPHYQNNVPSPRTLSRT